MTANLLGIVMIGWGAVMVFGGAWATYAGHRSRDSESGGMGGYLLGGLMVILGIVVWLMAAVVL